MLSKSIEKRALDLIEKGIEVIEAVKQAIQEEQTLINELIENRTQRSKNVRNQMCKNTYAIIHLKNAIQ
jgi:hypothetical protein